MEGAERSGAVGAGVLIGLMLYFKEIFNHQSHSRAGQIKLSWPVEGLSLSHSSHHQ
jgi:hypothetical protein